MTTRSPSLALALLVILLLAATALAQSYVVEGEVAPPDPVALADFGVSIAMDGDTLVAGASGATGGTGPIANAGAAYVYVRSGSVWSFQQKLVAPDGAAADEFGSSVALSGDTIAVGAKGHDEGASGTGAVYIFTRSGSTWSLQQELLATNPGFADNLGYAVALEGDTLVAGAPFSGGSGNELGSAHVFVRSAGTWTEQQELLASDGGHGDRFGWSVALSGDTVFVGAFLNDLAGPGSGAAYAFVRSGSAWSEQQVLSPPAPTLFFAVSVALAGDLAVVGAENDGTLPGQAGAAFVFERSAGVWGFAQEIRACDPFQGEFFGQVLATDGTRILAGARFEGGEGVATRGALYVFDDPDGTWRQQVKVLVPGIHLSEALGTSVALSGDTMAGGAPGADDAGKAYVFRPTPLVQLGCVGDGSCPCANPGAPRSGCNNAQGTGGSRLEVVAFDPDGAGGGTAKLLGCGFPPAAAPTVLAIRSTSSIARTTFGDGLLCIAPPVVRFGASAASLGASNHAISHGAGAGTFHYQLWYRNTPVTFCDPSAASNLSNALSIAWP